MLGRHDALEEVYVQVGDHELRGSLGVPESPVGLVVLAGTRDQLVSEALRARQLATLEVELDARLDLEDLSLDLVRITDWTLRHPLIAGLPLGYLGVDSFAAAAVLAAAHKPESVRAVVALGGRIDTAGSALADVRAPTLLVCGREDEELIERDREAIELMTTVTQLAEIPGAFAGGTMNDAVIHLAGEWFVDHFVITRRVLDQLVAHAR